jgi:hypothetical protein
MLETQLLLFRPAAIAQATFAEALQEALPANAGLAIVLPENALPALAHVAGRDPEVPDALVTLSAGQDATAIVALADTARSSAFTGLRHSILPGKDAIRLFFGLRRLPRLTRKEFQDYWLNHHADIGRRLIPPYTYHQIHAVTEDHAEQTAGVAASSYDGIVEVHFPDVEAFVRQLSRAEIAVEALEDEKNFIDHSRSAFWAFREIV